MGHTLPPPCPLDRLLFKILLWCRAGCRCCSRCTCWSGCRCWRWCPSQNDREIIKGFEVYHTPSSCIITLDYITRLHKWQFGREGEASSENGILPFYLNVIDGVTSLQHR